MKAKSDLTKPQQGTKAHHKIEIAIRVKEIRVIIKRREMAPARDKTHQHKVRSRKIILKEEQGRVMMIFLLEREHVS